MNRPGRPAAARLALILLAASLALALVQPTLAGTQEAPEVADAANDQSAADTVPISQQPPAGTTVGLSVDLLFGWVEEPAADTLQFTVQVQGTGGASTNSEQEWRFHFTAGGTEYIASAHEQMANQQGTGQLGDGSIAPGGVATAAVAAGDSLIVLTVPKSAVGNPAPGAVLSNLFVESESFLLGQLPGWITDRAPDDGAGADYTVTGGAAGGNVTAGGSDGDGLNDTCEQKYFGGLNSTANATGDADGDGLTNGQECALGTDPTKADTDGDGVPDNQDPAPTDPTQGGNTTSSTSSSSHSTTSRSTTHPPSSSSNSKGSVTDFAGAIDKLQSDPGYLGMSAGGFLAVLVLCIIGLAVRWSL